MAFHGIPNSMARCLRLLPLCALFLSFGTALSERGLQQLKRTKRSRPIYASRGNNKLIKLYHHSTSSSSRSSTETKTSKSSKSSSKSLAYDFYPHITESPATHPGNGKGKGSESKSSKSNKSKLPAKESSKSSKSSEGSKSSKSSKNSKTSSRSAVEVSPTRMPVPAPTPMPVFVTEHPTGNSCNTEVVQFWLVDSRSDMRLRRIRNGEVISLSGLVDVFETMDYNIEVQTTPERVGSIQYLNNFTSSDGTAEIQNNFPYFVGSERNGVMKRLDLVPGEWVVMAIPFCQVEALGGAGQSMTLSFSIENDMLDTPAPTASTESPTDGPTDGPTVAPSFLPTMATDAPQTAVPTGRDQTPVPTDMPSPAPSALPTAVSATFAPTNDPSQPPSASPSIRQSSAPTPTGSRNPTSSPTEQPTAQASANPTVNPTLMPSSTPSNNPTILPSTEPTLNTPNPTLMPSFVPSQKPSELPTRALTAEPTIAETDAPTSNPTVGPSSMPSTRPSGLPTGTPTNMPTNMPTVTASSNPTGAFAVVRFWLLRASNQERLLVINEGDTIDLAEIAEEFGTTDFQIEAETNPAQVGIVRFSSNNALVGLPFDSTDPYTTPSRPNTPFLFTLGAWELTAEPFERPNFTMMGTPLTINFEVVGGLPTNSPTPGCIEDELAVTGFWLTDADTGARLGAIRDGNMIDIDLLMNMAGINNFRIDVDTEGSVGAVRFASNMPLPEDPMNLDSQVPFSIPINPANTLDLRPGEWSLEATPFCDETMQRMGESFSASFTILGSVSPCPVDELFVTNFWLIDAFDGRRLLQIFDDDFLVADDLVDDFNVFDFQFEVEATEEVGAVKFTSNRQLPIPAMDSARPFTLPGTLDSPIVLVAGDWELTATPFCTDSYANSGTSATIRFSIL